MAIKAAKFSIFGSSNTVFWVVLARVGTCSPYLGEKVIVESSWLTTTEDSLVRQGSSRVCEIVVLSVGHELRLWLRIIERRLKAFVTNLFEPKAAVLGRATRWKFVTPARMFPHPA